MTPQSNHTLLDTNRLRTSLQRSDCQLFRYQSCILPNSLSGPPWHQSTFNIYRLSKLESDIHNCHNEGYSSQLPYAFFWRRQIEHCWQFANDLRPRRYGVKYVWKSMLMLKTLTARQYFHRRQCGIDATRICLLPVSRVASLREVSM